jgi:hypothetical protein
MSTVIEKSIHMPAKYLYYILRPKKLRVSRLIVGSWTGPGSTDV